MTETTTTGTEREFLFDQRHFEVLRTLAREEAGIELNDSKRELVYGRLARRLRELKLDGFDDYCRLVTPKGSTERSNFVNCITTNVTSFFREDHHFAFLEGEALPRLMRQRADSRRIRIWSAACSTGQEPYSIAISAAKAIPGDRTWDWKILATDIDSKAVARAEAGIYSPSDLSALSPGDPRRQSFRSFDSGTETRIQVEQNLRKSIYFRVLNLMDPWPMSGPLDIIFCRNVVIYFSKETQRTLFNRFAKILAPDGYLFIGHSESMLHASDTFEPVGRTIYQLKGAG